MVTLIRLVGGLTIVLLVAFAAYFAWSLFHNWSQARQFAQLTDTADLKGRVDKLAADYVGSRKHVRLTVGIYQRGRRHVAGFGSESVPDATVDDGQWLYEIGSITKVFTGILLAQMELDGNVRLEDPLRKYVPSDVELSDSVGSITLQQLATHTSGLPRLPANLDQVVADPANPYADYREEHLHSALRNIKTVKAGKQSSYSNFGAGVLGHVLSRKSGRSYAELVQQRICEPLGLKDTRVHLSDEQTRRLLNGYSPDGEKVSHWDFDVMASAGALRSTANDLLTFIAAHLDEEDVPLTPALKRAMVKHYEHWSGSHMGLGWQILDDVHTDLTIYWHNGGTGGFFTFLGMVPSERTGVVLLSNYGDAWSGDHSLDEMGLQILKWACKVSLEPDPTEPAVSADTPPSLETRTGPPSCR